MISFCNLSLKLAVVILTPLPQRPYDKSEEEKMELELHVANVIDDHKIKTDAMRLKIRKYAIDSESWYHYVVASIVTLVVILIAFVVAFKCFS